MIHLYGAGCTNIARIVSSGSVLIFMWTFLKCEEFLVISWSGLVAVIIDPLILVMEYGSGS